MTPRYTRDVPAQPRAFPSRQEQTLSSDDKLPVIALLFAAGVWLGTSRPFSDVVPWIAIWLTVAVLCVATGAIRQMPAPSASLQPRRYLLLLLLPLGVVRGVVCESLRPCDVLREAAGGRVFIRGVVAEPEIVTPRACRLVVRVDGIAWRRGATWQYAGVGARLLVTVPAPRTATRKRKILHWPAPAHWGQEICVQGLCEIPRSLDGGFDYAAWLAERDIFEIVRVGSAADISVCGPGSMIPPLRLAARVRRAMEATFETLLPQPHAALLAGVVLAEGKGLSPELGDAFRATGTYHVLVTAGIHVHFVVVGCITILGACGLGGGRAALVTIPAVSLYALVAGASPSIIRAAIMGTISLLGHSMGRPAAGRRGLACAVLMMTAWNPRLVREAGFQMSVACVLGILLLAPPLQRRLRGLPDRIRGIVAVTLATQIMVAPLSAMYFGSISLIGVLANVAVVPLCEALLGLGLLLGVSDGLTEVFRAVALGDVQWQGLMHIVAVVAWALASAVLRVVSFLHGVPGCEVQVSATGGREVVVWYGAMWLISKLLRRSRVPENVAQEHPEMLDRRTV